MQIRIAKKIADIRDRDERYLCISPAGNLSPVGILPIIGMAAVCAVIALGVVLIAGPVGALFLAASCGAMGGAIVTVGSLIYLGDKIPCAFIGMGLGSMLGVSLTIGLGFGLAFASATFGLSLLLGPLLAVAVGLCIGLWRDRVAYKKYKAEAVAEIEAEDRDKNSMARASVNVPGLGLERSRGPGVNPALQFPSDAKSITTDEQPVVNINRRKSAGDADSMPPSSQKEEKITRRRSR